MSPLFSLVVVVVSVPVRLSPLSMTVVVELSVSVTVSSLDSLSSLWPWLSASVVVV